MTRARFVRVGDVPLHVVVDGSGPPCVLSPGLGMCWFDWDPVVRLLAPHRTVIRFDRPGLGLSGPARGWPTLLDEVGRIAGVLAATGADGPVTLVGHSLAGFHCEAFARLHPGRTAALLLLDSSVEDAPRPRRARSARNAVTRAGGTLLCAAGVPRALGPRLRRAAVRAERHGGADPAPYDLVRRAYSTSRSLHAILAENAGYRDQAVDLATLRWYFPLPRVPVTVLAAGSERRLRHQRALANRLGATFSVADPAGRMVMLDRPREVADAVLATT
ncbi:alpha/beta fold hydrolase [Streptomyces cavernae]|uniref:alpha/beta fold hydrolase n=1 Tax=Streptomyces cavernae TaxID=2259034 RepID=UPI000FEC1E31|nr:alpha/beta hydrolase [Streptomyces cavernae]